MNYRVWNKYSNEYIGSAGTVNYGNNIWGIEVKDSEILELATPLKDGNDKQIFIGDVLWDSYNEVYGTVNWSETLEEYRFYWGGVSEAIYEGYFNSVYIIGNIHEPFETFNEEGEMSMMTWEELISE